MGVLNREFVRRFAPQLAYANPTIPFHVEHIPDPRRRSRQPDAAPILPWPGGERPAPQMTIEFGMSAHHGLLPLRSYAEV